MQEYLEKLLYFWAGITAIGLVFVIIFWAISTIIYVAFISLFIAIIAAAFYQFYWSKRNR
jgi:predicted PurR-regulated permease PerM